MGNFFSLSQWNGCKTRPTSIFGIPKKNFNKHTVKPLVAIHTNSSSLFHVSKNFHPTIPPYLIEDRTL